METYSCAYRDPKSPLTPLPPVSEVTLRETLRSHSPTLIPINKIVLDKCPPPKRKRSSSEIRNTKKSTDILGACPINIVVSSEKTPSPTAISSKSNYLQNLRRILTPNSRYSPKSMDLTPTPKRSRFNCFQNSPSIESMPLSPRVLRILQDIGQDKYSDVFQREEIDFEVFKILTRCDLMKLGIDKEKDISVILNAIRLVKFW